MTSTFTGPAVDIYVAVTLTHGLRLYAATGIKPNRMWTPKNMMGMAAKLTGKTFKPRDYLAACDALEEWIANAKVSIDADRVSATCH